MTVATRRPVMPSASVRGLAGDQQVIEMTTSVATDVGDVAAVATDVGDVSEGAAAVNLEENQIYRSGDVRYREGYLKKPNSNKSLIEKGDEMFELRQNYRKYEQVRTVMYQITQFLDAIASQEETYVTQLSVRDH